jgi:hypothetical protein
MLDSGLSLLYNFDGMFAHSCRSETPCPPLEKYASNKSSQELEMAANKRDEFIQTYIRQNLNGNFQYKVFSDCCPGPYNKYNLDQAFLHDFTLRDLIEPYMQINGDIECLSPYNTFIAQVRGSVIPDPNNPFPPIFTWINGKPANVNGGTFLLTKDTYLYLKANHGLVIEKVESAVFYKKDNLLPKFYQKLLLERSKYGPVQSKIIKSIINYSTGIYGSNPNKLKSSRKRLVYKPTAKFNFETHHCTKFEDNILIETFPKTLQEKLSYNALGIYVTIIEFGKLRILQLLDFYKKHLDPRDYRILYIHIDSTIIALSGSTLDDTVRDANSDIYKKEKSLLFDKNRPGMAKLEWQRNELSPWFCITPRQQFFVLLHPDTNEGIYKMSGGQNLSASDAFFLALKYAERKKKF